MKEHKEIKNLRELIEKTKTVETIDASLGGMQFAGELGLSQGDILTLKISLPTISQPLSAFAEVAWVRTNGAGVRFLSMKEEDRKSLDHFLQGFQSGA
jgi:hypothetical protein